MARPVSESAADEASKSAVRLGGAAFRMWIYQRSRRGDDSAQDRPPAVNLVNPHSEGGSCEWPAPDPEAEEEHLTRFTDLTYGTVRKPT